MYSSEEKALKSSKFLLDIDSIVIRSSTKTKNSPINMKRNYSRIDGMYKEHSNNNIL